MTVVKEERDRSGSEDGPHSSDGDNSVGLLELAMRLEIFDFEVKSRTLQAKALIEVFKKSGSYIFNLGLVNFFEYITINLLVFVFAYNYEA